MPMINRGQTERKQVAVSH